MSQLVEIEKECLSIRMKKIKSILYSKYKINDDTYRAEAIEKLKQKIQAKAQRLRRYTKRQEFFKQNQMFNNSAKKFYNYLDKQQIEVKVPPRAEDVKKYWSNIWENEKRV